MKIAFAVLLVTVCNLAQADDIGERIAYGRSANLVDAIAKGELDLKKALEYGDEAGFEMEDTRRMTRQLKWWRENEEKNVKEFAPYQNCFDAAVAFNRYGTAHWGAPSLRRDRTIEESRKSYKDELTKCHVALKRAARFAHVPIRP